jgi:ketosteroid isomerase-like protein
MGWPGEPLVLFGALAIGAGGISGEHYVATVQALDLPFARGVARPIPVVQDVADHNKLGGARGRRSDDPRTLLSEVAVTNRELVIAYYDACNSGDAANIARYLTEDMVHYFLAPNPGSAPMRGGVEAAAGFARVQRSYDGRWVVDHWIGDGDEAVIEWTLFWTSPKTGERVATRGAELYRFRDGKIAEVRAYYRQRHETSELEDFDYPGHGYSYGGSESSAIHR